MTVFLMIQTIIIYNLLNFLPIINFYFIINFSVISKDFSFRFIRIIIFTKNGIIFFNT